MLNETIIWRNNQATSNYKANQYIAPENQELMHTATEMALVGG